MLEAISHPPYDNWYILNKTQLFKLQLTQHKADATNLNLIIIDAVICLRGYPLYFRGRQLQISVV